MRARGEGTVTLRKDGRYQVAVMMPNGRRRFAYLPKGSTKKAAKERLEQLLRDREDRLDVTSDSRLGPFLRRWLDDFGPSLRPSTLRHYEMIVRVHLEPALGRKKLADVTPAVIQAYLRDKAREVSTRTVHHHHSVLRRALNIAVRWRILRTNAAMLVDAPRVPRFEPTTLTADQVKQLLAATADDRLHALWVLAASTAMRQAELLGLTWRDIDLEAGSLKVQRALTRRQGRFELVEPKSAKSRRSMPLSQVAIAALRAHRARQHRERLAAGAGGTYDGLVFTSSSGMPLHASEVIKAFYRALERAQLPRVRFHDLRHGAITIMLEQGVHPRIVMEWAGHSTIGLTMDTYSHVRASVLRETSDAMDRALEGAS